VNSSLISPIDAVITWVDGADPLHSEKLNRYLTSIGGARPHSANPARFNSVGEIEYCVVSLLRYAPWIRTIFIVTDNQQPSFMTKLQGTPFAQRIKIVDHSVIFSGREECLPSFNSMSISSQLWRIPNLAEQFLFLNDDFALIRPVGADAFFCDQKLVLRGHWQVQSNHRWYRQLWRQMQKMKGIKEVARSIDRVKFIGVQENSARLFGYFKTVFQLEHNPHPWKLSQWELFEKEHADVARKNCCHHLRSAEQLVPEGIIAHLALRNNEAVIDNRLQTLQLKPADQALVRIKSKLARAERNESYVFVCIQSLENAPAESFELVTNWLRERIGNWDDFIEVESKKSK